MHIHYLHRYVHSIVHKSYSPHLPRVSRLVKHQAGFPFMIQKKSQKAFSLVQHLPWLEASHILDKSIVAGAEMAIGNNVSTKRTRLETRVVCFGGYWGSFVIHVNSVSLSHVEQIQGKSHSLAWNARVFRAFNFEHAWRLHFCTANSLH